ncbi:MAG: HAMP domain-containing histidine kinase [Calditrichaeota bacterium]|nr:HAMP domain-containing histidine kinase [Calditrichota bacterium]
MICVHSKKSLKTELTNLLDECQFDFRIAEPNEEINQSLINILVYSDSLATELDGKLSSNTLSNPLFLFCESGTDIGELDKYPISRIYRSIPSTEQFNDDLNRFLKNKRQLIQHYKNYFIGMLLESALHELNNPITSISLNCQLILELAEGEGGIGMDQVSSMVGSINNTVNTAATVSKNLVNFARQQDYEAEFFNGKDILNATYIFMKPVVRMKRHDLTIAENDALIFANKSDFSLLFIILVYLLVSFLDEKDLIEIAFAENLMTISFNKPLTEFDHIYLKQKFPVFHLRQIINEICRVNKFDLNIVDGNIHITTSQEMPEE